MLVLFLIILCDTDIGVIRRIFLYDTLFDVEG